MTRKITTAALLAATALIIFVVEAQIPTLTPVPGIKLGLSNIVTLFALYSIGPWFALAVLAVRILLGGLITGQVMALLYSFSGGLLAFFVSVVIYRLFPLKQVWVVSAIAAVFHNVGQIIVAIAVTSTPELIVYLPVLIVAGIVAGVFTGLCAQFLLIRLEKLNLVSVRRFRQQ